MKLYNPYMSIHNLILNLHTFIILHSFNSSPKKATNFFASKACHAAMRSQWAGGGGGGGSRSRCGFGEVQGSSVRFQHVVHAFQRPADLFFHRDVVRKNSDELMMVGWWADKKKTWLYLVQNYDLPHRNVERTHREPRKNQILILKALFPVSSYRITVLDHSQAQPTTYMYLLAKPWFFHIL